MAWLLHNARVLDRDELVDIVIVDGTVEMCPTDTRAEPRAGLEETLRAWDLDGRVVLPGLVDIHTHLDKSFCRAPNHSGTLLEAIETWRKAKRQRSRKELRQAVRRALETAIANGTTAMRSHVDTEHDSDLETVDILLELRQEMKERIDLQLVALGFPGNTAENDRVIESALKMGVEMVGGAPAISPEPVATIDASFELAERLGKPLDLHLDETEDPQVLTLEAVADRTLAYGMEGRVTVGHCCSLAFMEETRAARIMDLVARAGIHVVTLPLCNLVLMGRNQHPVPRGTTRVKELLARGITVSSASDNVQDPFNPLGSYDLLQIANVTAAVTHMTGEAELYRCLDLVSTNPASRFQETSASGCERDADLVVLDCKRMLDAVTAPPPRLATFKRGKLVARTRIERMDF